MGNKYICPHCKGHLRVAEHIVFLAKTEDRKQGLILLNPVVGNYETLYDEDTTGFMVGDKLDVHCPICRKHLSVNDVNENLAMVILVDEEKNESKIYFSQILGERCTYKIYGQKRTDYGEDSLIYNHWGNMSDY